MGPQRSPFVTAHMTSYRHSIVIMAVSRVISKMFSVEKWLDLEIQSEVTQGH